MKWLNYLVLITCCIVCTVCAAEKGAKGYKNIGVEEFAKLRDIKTNIVLDVRTPREFQAGHLAGAINIDWNGSEFAKKAEALDKSKTYLVYCASGNRSAKASDKMSQLEFPKLYNLEGGIRAWQGADKPVER
jgi:rhodanese-related sulfurtransferase